MPQPDPNLLCAPGEKIDRELANQQSVLEYIAHFVESGRNRITEADVLELHRLTIEGIYPCAGNYRDARMEIHITDTRHKPSIPAKVRIDVRDMLEWHYGEGQALSPIARAARLMWRVNAIHPFAGGNGRVARSLAYLAIVSEVAPIFAGEPLPAKLKERKAEYVKGLKSADRGHFARLEKLVLECFRAQLEDITRQADGAPTGGAFSRAAAIYRTLIKFFQRD